MEKGWVAAGDLENGDDVYLIDGDSAVVTGSELEKPDEAIKVYNLEVEGYNTYFVGDDGVLVHNYPDTNNTETPETLYHYTNEKGQKGILESQELNPSLKANNPKDARYGNGQYLSDTSPYDSSPSKLAREFIHIPNKYKYTHYIEILVKDLPIIKGRDGVYVIPNDKPLDLTNRIISWGSVGEKK